MKEVYCEIIGERKYRVLEGETEGRKSYSIGIDDCVVNDFTSVKEKAIQFIELLIVNVASPVHLKDITEDYIS